MTAPPFQVLIDEHSRPVLAFLRGSVGPDAPTTACRSRSCRAPRIPARDADNLRAWLFKIAHNKAIDHPSLATRGAEPRGRGSIVSTSRPDAAPAWLAARARDE